MTRAIDPRQPFDFILPVDRRDLAEGELDDRIVWHLRALMPSEEARIKDGVVSAASAGTDEQAMHFNSGSTEYETLKLGLQGWDKMYDASDNPIAFKGKQISSTQGKRIEATEDDLARIPPKDRTRIANAITAAGQVTEEEAGKS